LDLTSLFRNQNATRHRLRLLRLLCLLRLLLPLPLLLSLHQPAVDHVSHRKRRRNEKYEERAIAFVVFTFLSCRSRMKILRWKEKRKKSRTVARRKKKEKSRKRRRKKKDRLKFSNSKQRTSLLPPPLRYPLLPHPHMRHHHRLHALPLIERNLFLSNRESLSPRVLNATKKQRSFSVLIRAVEGDTLIERDGRDI
jgi:hypothetical protein